MEYHLPKFVHLRVHSAYSLLEGGIKIPEIRDYCLQHKMPAIAITDRNNLFGALEISQSLANSGVQPIAAASLMLFDAAHQPLGSIALYAKTEQGYRNLCKLVSHAYLPEGIDAHDDAQMKGEIGIHIDRLADYSDGLICLTGGAEGPINLALRKQDINSAKYILSFINNIFKENIYVEFQRYPGQYEPAHIEPSLLELAQDFNLPVVATNQCYFHREEDYRAHDALICIAEGRYINEDERRKLTPHHYLKSPEEMQFLFQDMPEALQNTVEIARRCSYRPVPHAPILPAYSDDEIDENDELARQAEDGLQQIFANHNLAAPEDEYKQRLAFELNVIKTMGYPGYFLIVSDFIKWAKQNDIKVGPGRGSGAGSLVAWALSITDLDPIKYGLLFERFLNPERVSLPDFDIDFCQSRRDEVIAYVQQKYGKQQVAQIITFGKLQARAVLRDVGRVLQMPYGQVDRLCKMVPNNPADPKSLAEAIAEEPRFEEEKQQDPNVAELLEIGLKLEGLYRHASTHAAGLVIGDRPLVELIPLYRDPHSDMSVTQFSMKMAEEAGLVKFDFLGLKTLTVIEKAQQLLAELGVRLDFAELGDEDEATYKLLSQGNTVGVFQLEGKGMRNTLKTALPQKFTDIVALISLYRPGPMENIAKYIAVKNKQEEPDYMDEALQPVLEETYGVIVYQEQVMQIAQIIANYSLGDADLLRRAMGKKIKSEMDLQKSRFIDGAVQNNIAKAKADMMFERIVPFAGYGFNKSHAAAYAVLTYQTGYIKANYPVAFYAASMSLDFENTDKLSLFTQDAKSNNINVLSPSINLSQTHFSLFQDQVLYGLAAIKNVGTKAMEEIVKERQDNGAFKDVFDFARRVGHIGLTRRMVQNLIAAGAFDTLEPDRARLYAGLDIILGEANIAQSERESQQSNLFGEAEIAEALELPPVPPWTIVEQLSYERDAIGYFLSGHPLDEYETALKRLGIVPLAEVEQYVKKELLIAGIIAKIDYRTSQRGQKFAFVTVSDASGQMEVAIFSELLSQTQDKIEIGKLVIMGITISKRDDQTRLIVEGVYELEQMVANAAAGLRIFVESPEAINSLKERLASIRQKQTLAGGHVSLITMGTNYEVELHLEGSYAITPPVANAIKAIPGIIHAEEI